MFMRTVFYVRVEKALDRQEMDLWQNAAAWS